MLRNIVPFCLILIYCVTSHPKFHRTLLALFRRHCEISSSLFSAFIIRSVLPSVIAASERKTVWWRIQRMSARATGRGRKWVPTCAWLRASAVGTAAMGDQQQ